MTGLYLTFKLTSVVEKVRRSLDIDFLWTDDALVSTFASVSMVGE